MGGMGRTPPPGGGKQSLTITPSNTTQITIVTTTTPTTSYTTTTTTTTATASATYTVNSLQSIPSSIGSIALQRPISHTPILYSDNNQNYLSNTTTAIITDDCNISNSPLAIASTTAVDISATQNLPQNNIHKTTNSKTQQTTVNETDSNRFNNTKRNRSSPGLQHTNKPKQSKLNEYWLQSTSKSNISSNRFEILANTNEEEETNTIEVPKPPPIYVSKVENIQPLNALLQQLAQDEYELKILNGEEVKIQAKDESTYSSITKALLERNTEFHTYKLKSEQNFNVVLRGLHHSTDVESIKEEIRAYGHEVINVSNIKGTISKKPFPMFWVNLKPNQSNKEIYEVKYILSTKISFEPPKPKRVIPQCINCQMYGHTKKFCHHSPRCVKCTGNHHTKDCPRKIKSNEVKCVLCEENHPANYKGCSVYKQLQRKIYPKLRNKEIPVTSQTPPLINTAPQNVEQTYQTYAEAVSNQPTANPNTDLRSNDMVELKTMMASLMQQMGTLLNLLTSLIANISK